MYTFWPLNSQNFDLQRLVSSYFYLYNDIIIYITLAVLVIVIFPF